mmetsp:Transcript_35804/g.75247  ORF Transcript_35804/g.75247 Transcript_35804/m.75247 type:complete len:159 (+) Transcript_35804:944-1420(+)
MATFASVVNSDIAYIRYTRCHVECVFYSGIRIAMTLHSGTIGHVAPKLQELEMSKNKISGTLPTSLPTSLQYIFLESNLLSGTLPKSFSRLRRLKELELSENAFSGSVPASVSSLHLDHLDLQQNRALQGVPKSENKGSRCSGGADKYLRGAIPNRTS